MDLPGHESMKCQAAAIMVENSEILKNKDLKQDEFQSEDEDDGSRVIEMGKELSIYGTVNDAKEKNSEVRAKREKWLDDRTKGETFSVELEKEVALQNPVKRLLGCKSP